MQRNARASDAKRARTDPSADAEEVPRAKTSSNRMEDLDQELQSCLEREDYAGAAKAQEEKKEMADQQDGMKEEMAPADAEAVEARSAGADSVVRGAAGRPAAGRPPARNNGILFLEDSEDSLFESSGSD